jgi:hypothetical protein
VNKKPINKRLGIIISNALSILLLLSFLILFSRCNINNESSAEQREFPEPIISTEKYVYAGEMGFRFQVAEDGERRIRGSMTVLNLIMPRSPYFDPCLTDLVFVHTEEEAQGFPDNVIVAWPREGNWTQGLIAGIHWTIEDPVLGTHGRPVRELVTLEDFGLTYPLTVEDLVDNWEKVNALWNVFDLSEQTAIRGGAPWRALPNNGEPEVITIDE